MAQWRVLEYAGEAGFDEIGPEWRRLYAEMPSPSLWHSFGANRVYLRHLCPHPERFRCLALHDGSRIRAILPVEERTDWTLGVPVRVWGLPRLNSAWRIADAIGPDDDAKAALLPAVLDYLRTRSGRPSLFVFGRTSDASAAWEGLDGLSAEECFSYSDGAAYIVPAESRDALWASLSGKSRRHLHVAQEHFEALDGARYVRACEPAELAEEFEHFLKVEASGWKGARGTAVADDPMLTEFYRALMTTPLEDCRREIHSLHAEGRCIASELALCTTHTCFGPKGGYDEAYSRLMPGRLLAHKTLEWCCDDTAIDAVNEMSDAEWLRQWHPAEDNLRIAYVGLRPISGRLLVLALRFRFGPLRRLVRAVKARRRHIGSATGHSKAPQKPSRA